MRRGTFVPDFDDAHDHDYHHRDHHVDKQHYLSQWQYLASLNVLLKLTDSTNAQMFGIHIVKCFEIKH